ncbi:MAG: DUF305 domain-containing protein [Mycobacterium sp.]|nr:DUF305 domain-containing protein [Mycobacterium sp.]
MAALAAVAAIGACSNSATKEAAPSAPSQTQTTASAQAAAHNMADMMFAHMMIPHHQQAIEMSDMVLAKQGMDPRVVELAQQIKDAQGPEIAQMQGWLDEWNMDMGDMPGHGGMDGSGSMMPDMPGMGGMGMMDGMLSPAEMQALKDAQGVEADKLFLTGMIKHHEGAITMAQNEIKNGEFPEAIELSKAIVESQQKEIDTMNEILKTL